MKKIKEQKAITLIALVITIIVLLILAGVTIMTLTGNNGILQKAGEAGNNTTNAGIEEQIKLAYNEYYISKYSEQPIDIQEKLQEIYGLGATATLSDENLIVKINEKGYIYKISTGEIGKIIDYSELKIGDYVNYPVYYNNVGTGVNKSTGEVTRGYPKDEYNGWRILNIDTTKNEIKLISAGVPMSYYHGNKSATSVKNLTTNFFSTPINSTVTQYNFYQCGFKEDNSSSETISDISNLKKIFTNKYTYLNGDTPKVYIITKNELDTAKNNLKITYPRESDILGVPSKDEPSQYYDHYCICTWLGSASHVYGVWNITQVGDTNHYYTDSVKGVRPVVILKPGIKFVESINKTNNTRTYDIYE